MLLSAFQWTDFQISYSYTNAYSCLYKHNKSQTLCKQGHCLDMDYHGTVLFSFLVLGFFLHLSFKGVCSLKVGMAAQMLSALYGP